MRLLLVIFLGASTMLAMAEKNYDQAKAELLEAFEKSSIQKEGSPPFQLTANFTLTFDHPVTGTYKLYWMSRSVWRHEIEMPGYQEKVVRNGDREWISRSSDHPSLPILQLLHLFRALEGFELPNHESTNIALAKEDPRRHVHCIVRLDPAIDSKRFPNKMEYCIDPVLSVVVSIAAGKSSHPIDTLRHPDDVEGADNFYDFAEFAGKLYPRTLRHFSHGKVVVEAKVLDLKPAIAREGYFLPLPVVSAQPTCDHPTQPTAMTTVDPGYSEAARAKSITGTVLLFVSLSAEGIVTEASVIQSVEPGLDENAIRSVKHWKFKPSTCGKAPVPTEFRVEVRYREPDLAGEARLVPN